MSSPSETIGSLARRLRNKFPRRQGSMSSGTYDDAAGRGSHSTDTGIILTDDEHIAPRHATRCSLSGAITIVGSVNMDYIALVPAHAQKNRHVHVHGENSLTMPGGHGLNQAIACVRMSHYKRDESAVSNEPPSSSSSRPPPKRDHVRNELLAGTSSIAPPPIPLAPHDIDVSVKLVGMVGEVDGHLIRTELRSHGIDIMHLRTTDEKTGAAHISVDPYGDSIVESHAYANDRLRPEHIPPLEDASTGRRPDLLLVQLEIPVDTVQHAVKLAREADPAIPVILNPAPDNTPVPEDLWAVDHLIMNAGRADELCRGSSFYSFGSAGSRKRNNLSGRPNNVTTTTTATSASRNLGTGSRKPEDYWDDASHFHDLGARCVIITMGQNGAIGSVRERHRKSRRRRFDSGALVASTPGSAVKDTTGASDAFIGAYAVEILRQMKAGEEEDISRAMEMGIKAGGLAVRHVGSMRSIPWRDEVMTMEFDGVDDAGD
ncbi:Ribokinase-like protein [Rhypophila decipiens]